MKFILTTLVLLPLLILAQGPPDIFTDFGNGNNQGNSEENGSGGFNLPDDGPGVPQHVIDKFRERSSLKESWDANTQRVPKGAQGFNIGGKKIKFNNLIPVDDLYEPNARVFVDGWPQPRTIHLFKDPQDPTVRVVLDNDGALMRAARYMAGDGTQVKELLHMVDDVFGEFGSDDLDGTTVSAIVDVSFLEKEGSLVLVLFV